MCRMKSQISKRKRLYSKMKSIFYKQLMRENTVLGMAETVQFESESDKAEHDDDDTEEEEEEEDEEDACLLDTYDSDMDIMPPSEEIPQLVFDENTQRRNEIVAQNSFNILYSMYQRIILRRRADAGLDVENFTFPPSPTISVPSSAIDPIRTNGVITALFEVNYTSGKLFTEHGMYLMDNFWKRDINKQWKNQRAKAKVRVKIMLQDPKLKNIDSDSAMSLLKDKLVITVVEAMLKYRSLDAPKVYEALNDMMAYEKEFKRRNRLVNNSNNVITE